MYDHMSNVCTSVDSLNNRINLLYQYGIVYIVSVTSAPYQVV